MLQEKVTALQRKLLGKELTKWAQDCWWFKLLVLDGGAVATPMKEGVGKMYKCPECGIVHESYVNKSYGKYYKRLVNKYEDFPSYGLKRKVCDECQ